MESRRDVFQAIADPTRRDIIKLISGQSLTLNIRIMQECGLILIQQQGRERYCSIEPKKLAEVADWVEPYRKMWEGRFDRVDNIIKKLKSKKNAK